MEAALNSPLGRMALGATPLKIGRASDNTLVITDPQSSSHHAEVAPGFGGNGFQITDLGSTNGTFVNEQRLTPHMPRPLNAGDVIRIGGTQITYEVASASYQPPVSTPDYEPTILAAPVRPDAYGQPGAFSNANNPSQPPAYQQPQPGYPQPGLDYPQQPGYPQPGSGYPQQPGYPQSVYTQPQPGYNQQPGGFGQPAYETPKKGKSRTGCLVAVIVAVVLLIGLVGGGFLLLNKAAGPQKVLDAYCDGFKTDNAQEIYNTLDASQQKQGTVAQLQQALGLFQLAGGIKGCTSSNIQQNGSTATATVILTIGGSVHTQTEHQAVTLIQENGSWKIDSATILK